MKLSIALCTYNGEKFLRPQLDSIAGQTLPPDELVVCDDCSKDSTLAILKDFSQQASFTVHIHQNETNLGSTRNFEKAIRLCSGEIIALCDQDDVWQPNKLARLTEVLQAHPEAGYVFSNATLVDEELRPLKHSLWESVGFRTEIRQRFEQGEQVSCFARQHVVTGATMAFRASLRELTMPFPTIGNWIHDGWIALVASAIGLAGVAIDEPLIAYRQHSNQQIGAPSPLEEKKNKSLLAMYRELKSNQRALYSGWESHCLHILKVKEILSRLQEQHTSVALAKHLNYFQEFETHFLARREILTSKGFGRPGLILREVLAGRYARFSDSWRSVFRDIFL